MAQKMKDTENNWLSEQIEFEKKKSFWNLDDKRNLEREHAENCDARQEEKRHRLEHYRRKNVIENYEEGKSNFFIGCVIINALLCSFGAFAGLWSFVCMLQLNRLQESPDFNQAEEWRLILYYLSHVFYAKILDFKDLRMVK